MMFTYGPTRPAFADENTRGTEQVIHEETSIADGAAVFRVAEEMLSDGSYVFAVLIGNVRIDCIDYDAVLSLLQQLNTSGRYNVSLDEVGVKS